MTLTAIGWLVVDSLWQGTVIAGLTAMSLGLLHRAPASTRYRVAGAGLALMAMMPLWSGWSGVATAGVRPLALSPLTINQVIGFPRFIWWSSVVVPVIGACWLGGLAILSGRLAWEARRAGFLRRREIGPVSGDTEVAFLDLRKRLAPAASVDLRTSTRALVPMVVGWRRPLVLLPSGILSRLTPVQVRGIVAHELAHVARQDYAANLLQVVLDALLFHHPAARWLSRRIRTEREYCCDDVAIGVSQDALQYARALAILEDARAETRLAVAAASGTLLDRVQRMLGRPRRALTPLRGVLVAVAAVTIATPIVVVSMSAPRTLPYRAIIRPRTPPPAGMSIPPGADRPDASRERRSVRP